MQTSRMRVLPGLFATVVLTTVPLACGGSKEGANEAGAQAGAQAEAKAPAPVIEAKADDGAVAAEAGQDADAGVAAEGPAAGDPAAGGTSGGAETGGPATDGSGGAAVDETGGSAGEAGGDTTGGAVDPKALLKEIKSKRTKDDRAKEAVAEAEAAGAEPKDVAKALNARGEALYADPERAKAFFELALEKDLTYPVPAFNLAKQAAIIGELDEAKKWLTIVHERKGKKLLKQIEFDPMWEILKDDPDVRALLK